ncbi:MAG: ParB/RepB/Spo0J family partition protein [Clostridia bacterium]|nr:ParB/RepB/Spo0J family partition protein [Clostridia bacterium]
MAKKTGGLGKGISALIPDADILIKKEENELKPVNSLKLTQVEPNPNQPRKTFDPEKLQALSDSIAEHGLLQPIAVKKNENGFYTIIAGERRWRAAKMAGLKEIPAVVYEFDDKAVAELSLIENLQREDLNPIEEAAGYARLAEEFEMTQEEISKSVGKSRSAITNCMRLLNLSAPVRKLVEQLEISAGHARTLLAIEDKDLQEKTAYLVIEKDMSVRQLENYVNLLKKPDRLPKVREAFSVVKDDIEKLLEGALGTKVKIISGKKKGKIEIEFYDKESLDRIVSRLKRG